MIYATPMPTAQNMNGAHFSMTTRRYPDSRGRSVAVSDRYGQGFYQQQFNPAFVQMEYFGYMKRDPDDAGYAFWLGKLNQFPSFVEAQTVLAFISSPEY
jgi:hypothetical protein